MNLSVSPLSGSACTGRFDSCIGRQESPVLGDTLPHSGASKPAEMHAENVVDGHPSCSEHDSSSILQTALEPEFNLVIVCGKTVKGY